MVSSRWVFVHRKPLWGNAHCRADLSEQAWVSVSVLMMPHWCSDVTHERRLHGNLAEATGKGDETHKGVIVVFQLLQYLCSRSSGSGEIFVEGNLPWGDCWLLLTRQRWRGYETWRDDSSARGLDLISDFCLISDYVNVSIFQRIHLFKSHLHCSFSLMELPNPPNSFFVFFSFSFSIVHSLASPSRINKNLFWASAQSGFSAQWKTKHHKKHTLWSQARGSSSKRVQHTQRPQGGAAPTLHALTTYTTTCLWHFNHKGWKKRPCKGQVFSSLRSVSRSHYKIKDKRGQRTDHLWS